MVCNMVQETGEIRLTAKQIEILRSLPDAKLQAAFLLLGQVSPEALNAKIRRTEEDDALNAAGDPIRLAELAQLKTIAAIHGSREVWLGKSQINALQALPTNHLRVALRLMESVRQEDLNGLILHAQYGVTLEKDELRRLMTNTATGDRGRHTSQEPAQQDNDDAEAE
jgi:hypothetical protein